MGDTFINLSEHEIMITIQCVFFFSSNYSKLVEKLKVQNF
jgi:hypothetical protein